MSAGDDGSTASGTMTRAEIVDRRIDILSAVILSLATVLAAWSAFQSAKWSGEQSVAFAKANANRTESVRNSTLAGQQTQVDVATFIGFADAFAADEPELAEFYRDRAREEFRPALDAWLALEPLKNPDAPPTPFAMEEYALASTAEADRLAEEADRFGQLALDNNQRSDNYVLLAVLFASVLLFAGLAPKSRTLQIQVTMLTMAGIILLVGVGFLLAFPKTI